MRTVLLAAKEALILRSVPQERVSKDGPRARRPRLTAVALAGVSFLSACGQNGEAAPARTETAPAAGEIAAAPEKSAGPALWRVSDADSTIYLFGTFHLLPASMQWKTAAFDAAMAETATTIIEVDTKSAEAQMAMNALVRELGLNPPGATLSKTLGEERARRFAALADRYGASMAALEPLRPWLALITLSIQIMQKEGFSPESGVEPAVLARARSEGDAVAYLESAEYQIRALASLDEAEILADFDASLDQFDDFDAYAGRVLDAWRAGDLATLEDETLAPMRETAPGAFKTLITDRNRNWAGEIEKLMEGDERYFIAVGAGHLIGEESVVEMLEAEGLEVRRVQ